MRAKLGMLLGSLLAIGLIAAGCGGDDDGNGGDGEPLTQEQFVAEAQKICDENTADAEQAVSEVQAQADPQDLQQVFVDTFEALVPILRDTVNRIGELSPPEDLQGTLDEFVTGANEAFDEVESDPEAFFQRAARDENPFPDLQQQAQELGIPEDCLGAGGGEQGGTSTAPPTTP